MQSQEVLLLPDVTLIAGTLGGLCKPFTSAIFLRSIILTLSKPGCPQSAVPTLVKRTLKPFEWGEFRN